MASNEWPLTAKDNPADPFPLKCLLKMLFPLVRVNHSDAAKYAIEGAKELLDHLKENESNSIDFKRLRWILQSLNGAIEELILIIKAIYNRQAHLHLHHGCSFLSLPSEPKLASQPDRHVSDVAFQVQSDFTSGSPELLLWLCVSSAALKSTHGGNTGQFSILNYQRGLPHVQADDFFMLTVTLFSINGDNPAWEDHCSNYINSMVNSVPDFEHLFALWKHVFDMLMNNDGEELSQSLGCYASRRFLDVVKKLLLTIYQNQETSGATLVEYQKWWVLITTSPVVGTALNCLFTSHIELQQALTKWLVLSTLPSLPTARSLTERAAAILQGRDVAAVKGQVTSFQFLSFCCSQNENLLPDYQKKCTDRAKSHPNDFIALILNPIVVEELKVNAMAVRCVCNALPQILDKMNGDSKKSILGNEQFCTLLDSESLHAVAVHGLSLKDKCVNVLQEIFPSLSLSRASAPFSMPAVSTSVPASCNSPDRQQELRAFLMFDFGQEQPFIFLEGTVLRISLAAWVWLSGLKSLVKSAPWNNQLFDMVTTIVKQNEIDKATHNQFKWVFILDALISASQRDKEALTEHFLKIVDSLTDTSTTFKPIFEALLHAKDTQDILPTHSKLQKELQALEKSNEDTVMVGDLELPKNIVEPPLHSVVEWLKSGATIYKSKQGNILRELQWTEYMKGKAFVNKVRPLIDSQLLTYNWVTETRGVIQKNSDNTDAKDIGRYVADQLAAVKVAKEKTDTYQNIRTLYDLQNSLIAFESKLLEGATQDEHKALAILVFDPIKNPTAHRGSALFKEIFFKMACERDSLIEALIDSLKSLASFFIEKDTTTSIIVKFQLNVETDLLLKWRDECHIPCQPDDLRRSLKHLHINSTAKAYEGLLRSDRIATPFQPTDEMLNTLSQISNESVQLWTAVGQMPLIVSVLREVFVTAKVDDKLLLNPTQDAIDKGVILSLTSQTESILERMRGLGTRDASYNILTVFKHFIPFVAALTLSAGFNSLQRLTYLKKFTVEPIAIMPDAIQMLNNNMSGIVRIYEVEGSTTETGRILAELERIYDSDGSVLALCVGSRVSIRLIVPNALSKNELIISKEDDALADFKDRVVMLGNRKEESQVAFFKAWGLTNDLITLVIEAVWLGLKEFSIPMDKNQHLRTTNLPTIASKNEFYLFCVPVRSSSEESLLQLKLKEKLQAFITEQRSVREVEPWTLALPRQTANDVLALKETNEAVPLSVPFILATLQINAQVKYFGELKSALEEIIELSYKSKSTKLHEAKVAHKVRTIWCSYTIGSDSDDISGLCPVFFGDALRYTMARHSWAPLPFELFWCKPNTTVHDVQRFLEIMSYFRGCKYSVIGIDALSQEVSQVFLKGVSKLTDEVARPELCLDLCLLTGDKGSYLDLTSVLTGSVSHNGNQGEKQKEPFVVPNSSNHKHQSCTFVVGDFFSGKSHYAKKQAGTVALPHTGDALDLVMAMNFFRTIKSRTEAPPQCVWIDINSYMMAPTPQDPNKLLNLNHFLWMLIQNRMLVDEESGEIIPIPASIHFIVEVPSRMQVSSNSKHNDDSTLTLASIAHLGVKKVISSKLSDFDISESYAKVAAMLQMLTADENSVKVKAATWSWQALADAEARSVFANCFKEKLLPPSLFKNSDELESNGRFASLLTLLYARFLPQLSASFIQGMMWRHTAGFLHAMKLAVRQVCDRFGPEISITSEAFAQTPVYLPTTVTFITYPHRLRDPESTASGRLSSGSNMTREKTLESAQKEGNSRIKSCEQVQDTIGARAATALANIGFDEIDLSYVLTGEGNLTDIIDLCQALDEIGFITVDDTLIRALHCVERQQSRVPLIIEGATGVGKSYLLSMMFRIQLQYAIRMATTKVIDFLWFELIEHWRTQLGFLDSINLCLGKEKRTDIPETKWFFSEEGMKFRERLLEGAPLLEKLEPVFSTNEHAADFYTRFDALCNPHQVKCTLADYPVLVAPMPSCMQTKGHADKPKQRTLDVSMVRYFETLLNTHVEYEYKIVAHPDTKREDILSLLNKPLALAKKLSKSKDDRVNRLVIPVFIDETNTLVETAGLAKTIMCDLRDPTTGLSLRSEGIWFVGAINKKSEYYQTQELHPSLTSFVSSFQGLSNVQQRSYIEQILSKRAEFLEEERFKDLKSQLIDLVLEMHRQSEQLSTPVDGKKPQVAHLVSQREFHKVDSIITAIYSLLGEEVIRKKNDDKVADRDSLLVCTCITAIYYVYVARIREPEVRSALKLKLEQLCAGGVFSSTYLNDGQRVDTARMIITSKVIQNDPTKSFDLGPGVALTDTLMGNIFLTLLSCASESKNKLCLAIIGDSGMGKTLSSRIVERNLKGPLSKSALCRRLPPARYFYIQGTSTTTSEQVSLVCARAQKDQERDPSGCKSIVCFDEGSLVNNARLVHKSLHEPVDRKVISIIVLANKPFDDEANQNRLLVVWNERLQIVEVKALTIVCLGYNTLSLPAPQRRAVSALTKSYFDIAKEFGNRASTLQMRDYVYLLKCLAASNSDGQVFTPSDLKKAIEMNYGSGSQCLLGEVMCLFFKNMNAEMFNKTKKPWSNDAHRIPLSVRENLQQSYARYSSDPTRRLAHRPRFKLLIDPTETYGAADDAVALIRAEAKKHNPDQHVESITVSELDGDRRRSFEAKILSHLRIAMEKGHHVILRNPERLLSYLFDVLNLNYSTYVSEGNVIERAIVAIGADTELFDIHPLFLITFVFNASAIRRLESTNIPFLSRCEKYLLEVDLDEKLCSPVSLFASEWVGVQNLNMFHRQQSIVSAITSSAAAESTVTDRKPPELAPEHVFKANCQIMSLIPPDSFVRLCPKLARSGEYAAEYLKQPHFSLEELINTAEADMCTMASTPDILALRGANEALSGHHVADSESFQTFESLSSWLQQCESSNDSLCIILLVTSHRCRNADFMWSLRNEMSQLAFASSGLRRHPYILITGAACNVTAVFTRQWRYIFLDSCHNSWLAKKLLRSCISPDVQANLDQKASAKQQAEEKVVNDILLESVVELFAATNQPAPGTHYSQLADPRAALAACVNISPVKEALYRSISYGLKPSAVKKLVIQCAELGRSVEQPCKQPFMSILNQESKLAFLTVVRPLIRLVACSALIDEQTRNQYTSTDLQAEVESLQQCILGYECYCEQELRAEEGQPKMYICGYPECGKYRHPLSSWMVPVVWHIVSSSSPFIAEDNNGSLRGGERNALNLMKENLRIMLVGDRLISVVPSQFCNLQLSEAEKEAILLDVMQQFGLIPNSSHAKTPNEANSAYTMAALNSIRALTTEIWGAKAALVHQILLVAASSVKLELNWIRHRVMATIFLTFLRHSSSIEVEGNVSVHNIASTVANALVKSANGSEWSLVGLSLLFSFVFRTLESVTCACLYQAVVALLTDLDQSLVVGEKRADLMKRIVTTGPAATSPFMSLETLDKFSASCGHSSTSLLTWHLAGIQSSVKTTKDPAKRKQYTNQIIADIEYIISNANTNSQSAPPRQYFWPILRLLCDIAFDLSIPLDTNLTVPALASESLTATVDTCIAIVEAALPRAEDQAMTLHDSLSLGVTTMAGRIRRLLFFKISARIKEILFPIVKAMSISAAVVALRTQHETKPMPFINIALLHATCSLMSEVKVAPLVAADDSQAVPQDSQATTPSDSLLAEIKNLSTTSGHPFHYQDSSSDPSAICLLLAYYARANTLEGLRALVERGGRKENPIAWFSSWVHPAKSVSIVVDYYIPTLVRSSSEYQEIKNIVAKGGSIAGKSIRYVLHAIREEVFLVQCLNPEGAAVKRNAYNAALSLDTLDPLQKKVAALLLTPYKSIPTSKNEAIRSDIEIWLGLTIDNTTIPSLFTFLMVEICSHNANDNDTAGNFWKQLLLDPTKLKKTEQEEHYKIVFGSLFNPSTCTLQYSFDCGAKYDEKYEARIDLWDIKRISSAVSFGPMEQYTLFALLFAVISSHCLLFPEAADRLVHKSVLSDDLMDSIEKEDTKYSDSCRPVIAAVVSCRQHLRFLRNLKGAEYTEHVLKVHLMNTFEECMKKPPPIVFQSSDEAKQYYKVFAADLVAKRQMVLATVAEINMRLAQDEWEKKTVTMGAILPAVDPAEELKSQEVPASLLAYSFGPSKLAQLVPHIGRLYCTLNDLSSKLTPDEVGNLLDVSFGRMIDLADTEEQKRQLKNGMGAFNLFLDLNGGNVSVGCSQTQTHKLDEQSKIFSFVTTDKTHGIFNGNTSSDQQDGYLIHALTTIGNKMPSLEDLSMDDRLKDEVRDILTSHDAALFQSASIWSMFNPSASSNDEVCGAACKVISYLVQDTDHSLSPQLQSSIVNYFLLPAMQTMIDKTIIQAPFSSQRAMLPAIEVTTNTNQQRSQATLGVAFRKTLPETAADSFLNLLTDADSPFGKQPIEERIQLVDSLKQVMLDAIENNTESSMTLKNLFEIQQDDELCALVPTAEPPVCLQHASEMIAIIDSVKSNEYQLEHENRTLGRVYDLDVPKNTANTLFAKNLKANLSAPGTHYLYQYRQLSPTRYIDSILGSRTVNMWPTAPEGSVTVVRLQQVNGSFKVESTTVVASDNVAIPNGYIAFVEGGRVLGAKQVGKLSTIFLSSNHVPRTFQFQLDSSQNDLKVDVCADLTVGAIAAILETKLKGSVLIPSAPLPLDPSTLISAAAKCVFNKAPCRDPYVVIPFPKKDASTFTFMKPTDYFAGSLINAELVSNTLAQGEKVTIVRKGRSGCGNVLFTHRALIEEGGTVRYVFRVNLYHTIDKSCPIRLVNLCVQRQSLTCTELLAELVRTGHLSTHNGLVYTVALATSQATERSYQIVAATERISYLSQIRISIEEGRQLAPVIDEPVIVQEECNNADDFFGDE